MTLEDIKKVVDVVTGLNIATRTRKREYAYSRMIYFALAKEYGVYGGEKRNGYSLSAIASLVGLKHDVVLTLSRKFESNILRDREWKRIYDTCRYYVATKSVPHKINPESAIDSLIEENHNLREQMKKMVSTAPDTARLMSIYESLPDRLKEDVIFKVETAFKIHEKHKRDLTVIYTEV